MGMWKWLWVLLLIGRVEGEEPSIDLLHQEVLYTQVRIRVAATGGSGTIIYSQLSGEKVEQYSTYVLSCHHVVSDAIRVKTEWDSSLGRDVKREYRDRVAVEFFDYISSSKVDRTYAVEADLVAYDQGHDMALLKLRSEKQILYVARLYERGKEDDIRVFSKVMAVGCALGHDPIVTEGIVTHKGDEIDHREYWMSNAQIIYGNSGGAIFLKDTLQLIGIPSKVAVAGWSMPITHMGYFSPVSRVYEFLEEQLFQFLYDPNWTEVRCKQERERRRKAEEERLQLLLPLEAPDKEEKRSQLPGQGER